VKAVVDLPRLKFFQQLRLAAPLLVQFIVAGCVFRKALAPPPPPTYPAVPESAIQEVRQSAAQKGANVIVILSDTEFPQNVDKREVRIRRIVYLAIHRR